MRIILLGPPGSGKGTQGDLIEGKYGFPRISSGDLLRDSVRRHTTLGRKAEAFMNRGELVEDDIVVEMIRERIGEDDCRTGFILDGFPRTIPQAERLPEIDPGRAEIVLDIRVDDRLLVERLSARRICSGCGAIHNLRAATASASGVCPVCGDALIQREDDKPEVIQRRLHVYHAQTEPLVEYYRGRHVYHEIDGAGPVDAVFVRILTVLERTLPASNFREETKADR